MGDILEFFKKKATPMHSADSTFCGDVSFWKQVAGEAGCQRLFALAEATQPTETKDMLVVH
eukprot:10041882-Lingulodinium_polyedra.AAC.1